MAPFLPRAFQAERMPASTEVVVIGGGIIGACTALELAERGIPVVLCEKGMVGGEQSSRNMGWVRKMGRDELELPLAIRSLQLWDGLSERVGLDVGFRRSGVAYLFETDKQLERNTGWLNVSKKYGLDTKVINGDQVTKLFPSTTRRWVGALYTPSDGRAEPGLATVAVAAAAERKGATILSYCAVRNLETTAGKISGVVTEHGHIACNAVVLAGGAWSSLFCRNHDIEFPQLKITATVLRTAPVAGGPEVNCSGPGFVMRRNLDGGHIIGLHPGEIYDLVPDSFRFLWRFRNTAIAHAGRLRPRIGDRFAREIAYPARWSGDQHSPFEMERTLNPGPDVKAVNKLKGMMGKYFAALSQMKVVDAWAGLVDVTPDALPVISEVARIPGLVIASGFSGTGFAQGPAAGQLAASLVADGISAADPAPFKLERLTSSEYRNRPISIGGTP
jgi:glycine/D-amino acid oxidase-like deaminating enzyme